MLVILKEGRRAGETVDMPMPLALQMLALGRVLRPGQDVQPLVDGVPEGFVLPAAEQPKPAPAPAPTAAKPIKKK